MSRSKHASTRVLAAVLMLSAAGTIFELTLTRIFLFTVWYHYAFIAISVAVFGWSLGGFIAYLLQRIRHGKSMQPVLVGSCLILAICLPLFFWLIIKYPITSSLLSFYYVIGLLPFVAGGVALSQTTETYANDPRRLHLADATGAVIGTLLMPILVSNMGLATSVLTTAMLPALAGVMLSIGPMATNRRIWFLLAIVVLAGTVDLIIWHCRTQSLTLLQVPNTALYKLLHERPQAKIDNDRWNSYSRVTTVIDPNDYRLARLFIDSDIETSILKWDGTREGIPNARDWFRAFPYRLTEQPRVLVIGSGGGTDVILAYCVGSPEVTAIETNPLIVEAVNRWEDSVGHLYDHNHIKLVTEEPRSFMNQTDEYFDTIVLGFVEPQEAINSGAISLSEDYLFTKDALADYYDHLTEHGALAIIRGPADIPRLAANAVSFLSQRGMNIHDIGKRLLIASQSQPPSPSTSPSDDSNTESVETIFMLSKSPLESATVDRLLAGHTNAYILWSPGRGREPQYRDLFEGQITLDVYAHAFNTVATAVSDNRPFYFAVSKPFGLPRFAIHLLALTLMSVLGFAILLTVGSRMGGFRMPSIQTMIHFGALGTAFTACEVVLIQEFVLLLGNPLVTVVLVVFALLLAGNMSNLLFRHQPRDLARHRLGRIILAMIVVLVLAAFLLSPFLHLLLALPFIPRLLAASAFLVPLGYYMGMPLPMSVRQASRKLEHTPTSALWGISGAAGAVGAVGAALLTIVVGFTAVLLVCAAIYAVAWVTRLQ